MESRSSPEEHGRRAEIVVSGPDGEVLGRIALAERRVTVGRLREANDIALEPDPERLVTRAGHCAFEPHREGWLIVDGSSVNGTFLRRAGTLDRVTQPTPLRDGDVVSVLAALDESGVRRHFELAFVSAGDSQATRRAPVRTAETAACLSYDPKEARLVLVQAGERHEIPIRAQAHRLVRHMVERNGGGPPALCTHDELMYAVWADEPMHTRVELARLVWEIRRRLEPFGAGDLIENERRRGYRMRTCPEA
jgi:DNA-binding winged helix-turn-helix (wHTH) protein